LAKSIAIVSKGKKIALAIELVAMNVVRMKVLQVVLNGCSYDYKCVLLEWFINFSYFGCANYLVGFLFFSLAKFFEILINSFSILRLFVC